MTRGSIHEQKATNNLTGPQGYDPYYIEFLGLPGSGKSTFALAATNSLSQLNIPVARPTPIIYKNRGRPSRLILQLLVHIRHRHLAAASYGAAQRAKNRTAAYRRVPALIMDTERVRWAVSQMAPGELSVHNQAVLQPLRSLISLTESSQAEIAERALANIVRATGLGTGWLVVYIDSDPETASTRVQRRATNSGLFDRMRPDERLSAYQREYATQLVLVEALRTTGAAQVLTIDGTNDPRTGGDAIAQWVLSKVGTSKM